MSFPDFDQLQLSLYACAVAGATVLWAKSSVSKKKSLGYVDVLEHLIPNDRARAIVQFIVFVSFGGLVALIATSPTTYAQALAGGLAWSQITIKDRP